MSVDVWVDFNECDASGNVFTLEKFAEIPLSVGGQVLAGDEEGNTCRGTVIELDYGVVSLRLDLGSFSAASEAPTTSAAR